MKTGLFVLVVIAVIAVALFLGMVVAGVIVGVSAAMFLEIPFATGWEAAWDQPGYLFLFSLLCSSFFGSSYRSRR